MTKLFTLLAVCAILSIPAMADVYTFSLTIDHCTLGCGTGPFGTVTVTDKGLNTVLLSADVSPNFFVLGGQPGSTIAFNLNPDVSNLTVDAPPSGWTLDSSSAGSL